jgi:hypothetical protein
MLKSVDKEAVELAIGIINEDTTYTSFDAHVKLLNKARKYHRENWQHDLQWRLDDAIRQLKKKYGR